jgi:hypothetical protein
MRQGVTACVKREKKEKETWRRRGFYQVTKASTDGKRGKAMRQGAAACVAEI